MEDRDQLIKEYELTDEEADKICEILEKYEKENDHEKSN